MSTGREMNNSLRIKPHQKELIREKAIEINKLLIRRGMEPKRDSELLHVVIDSGVKMLYVTESGEVKMEN